MELLLCHERPRPLPAFQYPLFTQLFFSHTAADMNHWTGCTEPFKTERKMLTVARKLGEKHHINVSTTYLAAHALPPEYQSHMQDRADDYIEQVCEWLPILHSEGLVDAVDGFCENIAFSTEQIKQVFEVARSLDLPVKLHSEQLSDIGGSALVAEYQGLMLMFECSTVPKSVIKKDSY